MAFDPDPGRKYREAIVARRNSESARNAALSRTSQSSSTRQFRLSQPVTTYKPGFSPEDIAEKSRAAADQRAAQAAEVARGSAEQERQAAEQRVTSERQRVEAQQQEQATRNTAAMQGLVESYNQAYGAARESNEARYQQLLGIANETTGQRQVDITSGFQQQSSDAMQQLARLGMSNTTIAPTLQQGFERERQSALNRAADEGQQTKLGIIERREDAFPDLGSLQSILVGLGSQSGGGFGTAGTLGALGNIRQGPVGQVQGGPVGVGGFPDATPKAKPGIIKGV